MLSISSGSSTNPSAATIEVRIPAPEERNFWTDNPAPPVSDKVVAPIPAAHLFLVTESRSYRITSSRRFRGPHQHKKHRSSDDHKCHHRRHRISRKAYKCRIAQASQRNGSAWFNGKPPEVQTMAFDRRFHMILLTGRNPPEVTMKDDPLPPQWRLQWPLCHRVKYRGL